METKNCKYCNVELVGKRNDAKFCSNTCKARHWDEFRLVEPNKNEHNVTTQLRGLLDAENKSIQSQDNPQYKIIEVKRQNIKYLLLEWELGQLLDDKSKLEKCVHDLKSKLTESDGSGRGLVLGLATVGALMGHNSSKGKTKETILGGAIGLIGGVVLMNMSSSDIDENKKQQILKDQLLINEKFEELEKLSNKIMRVKNTLNSTPKFNVISQKVASTSNEIMTSKPLSGLKSDDKKTKLTNEKIINSQDLKNMEFKALNFKGIWNTLFGYPAINFHCVIHGMSGEGKSTFAIQFAKYLADNFGKVVYISGEEGFSKTFKDKFANHNATSEFLDVADIRTYEILLKEIPAETYNFIFIDSLDNMKIDAEKLKNIRLIHKNSALITISQSTKDGKMRGSYEIVHDSDIAINVVNGIATSTKNRFKEKGTTLSVFNT